MKVPFHRWFHRLSRIGHRFLLPWAAFFSLLTTTSNCPCCGQPGCPNGLAGMGILAGILAAITRLFRKRRNSKPETPQQPGRQPGTPQRHSQVDGDV